MLNKEKIIITGANGTIGQILQKGFPDYQITSLDLPNGDVRNYETLASVAPLAGFLKTGLKTFWGSMLKCACGNVAQW